MWATSQWSGTSAQSRKPHSLSQPATGARRPSSAVSARSWCQHLEYQLPPYLPIFSGDSRQINLLITPPIPYMRTFPLKSICWNTWANRKYKNEKSIRIRFFTSKWLIVGIDHWVPNNHLSDVITWHFFPWGRDTQDRRHKSSLLGLILQVYREIHL